MTIALSYNKIDQTAYVWSKLDQPFTMNGRSRGHNIQEMSI